MKLHKLVFVLRDGKMDAEITCPLCEKHHAILQLPYADVEKYTNGGLAQACFPYLGLTERESIISGLCAGCQVDIFGE